MRPKLDIISSCAFWTAPLWLALHVQFPRPAFAPPVNVISRPDGATHVQVGPINVLVQPGHSIFRPLGILVDVPTILHLRVASHPIGGTGVHVSVPILDGIWNAAKLPPPIDYDDDDDDEEGDDDQDDVDGTDQINKKQGEPVTNTTNISIAKQAMNQPIKLQQKNNTTAILKS